MVYYPHRITLKNNAPLQKQRTINFANRGMSFEKMINETNRYYLTHGLAVIHKKPTPIQIVKVDYPKRSRAKIVEAYFRQASTTDYSGVYKGVYIDFEAKETSQKQAMPLKNFHPHQIEHMKQVLLQKGICFVLLHFSSINETYLLSANHLIDCYQTEKGAKAISLDYIREYGHVIAVGAFPSVPYLEIVEKILLGGNHYD